jgi:hypothetical protein
VDWLSEEVQEVGQYRLPVEIVQPQRSDQIESYKAPTSSSENDSFHHFIGTMWEWIEMSRCGK